MPLISRTWPSRRPRSETSSTCVYVVYEQFLVALGTSCSSGRSRHTATTKPLTPEEITTPTHLLSSAGAQIAPTISLPTFSSCPRARKAPLWRYPLCPRHALPIPLLCDSHLPACAWLPGWDDLWNRPSPAPCNHDDDFLPGDDSLLSNLPARLSRLRTSMGLNLRGLPCHSVQS